VTQPVDGYDGWIGIAEREYGLAGGRLAGQWILEHFGVDAEVEVGIIAYPEMETIIDRGEGLKEAILALAPNGADADGLNVIDATILSAGTVEINIKTSWLGITRETAVKVTVIDGYPPAAA